MFLNMLLTLRNSSSNKKFLKDDGILLIDVPNEFNDFQIAGRDLHNLNDWWVAPPNHLNYFSKSSLENFLKELKFNVV